jgi:hypothetical protein
MLTRAPRCYRVATNDRGEVMKSWRDAKDGDRRGAEAKQERTGPGKHTLTERLGYQPAAAREAVKGGTDAKGEHREPGRRRQHH